MDLVEKKINESSSQRHPWEAARFEFFLRKIQSYIDLSSKQYIIDVGCGDAFFIAELSKRYPNLVCVGVDINFKQDDIAYLQTLYTGASISLYTTLAEATSHLPRVDLVLLMDVIEHIEYDLAFLTDFILPVVQSNDALLFITVPAFQSLFTKHDEFLGHYRRYDNRRLLQTVTQSHFKTIQIGYFFSTLIGLRLLEKIMDRLNPKRHAEGIANWTGGKLLTSIVYQSLIVDFKVSLFLERLGIKLPGLSNYVVCRRA
jgi:SAM-dependent methyltransferase